MDSTDLITAAAARFALNSCVRLFDKDCYTERDPRVPLGRTRRSRG